MKKTLLFAGIAALCITGGAFGFDNDSTTYPVFDSVNTTYPYASKKQSDGTVKIKHATTKYVTARAGEAQGLVDELTDRADDDDEVISDNTEALSGKQTQTGWADKGMDTNRQVKTTSTGDECASLNTTNSNAGEYKYYSGCGYITKNGNSVPSAGNYSGYSQTSGDYQWVKIRTNCGVQGQENAANCVAGSNNG